MRALRHIPPVVVLLLACAMAFAAVHAQDGLSRPSLARSLAAGLIGGAGLALIGWAGCEFRRFRTTIWPEGRPTHLLRRGPFRWSRNPIYVGLALIAAVPLVLTLAPVAAIGPVAFVGFVNGITIPLEEKRLAAAFPEAFADYCAHVRRWI